MRSWFRHATLAKAHRLSLGFIVGLLLLPTALSAWQLWSTSTKVDHLAKVGIPGAHIIGQLDGLMNSYRAQQWEYLAIEPKKVAPGNAAPGNVAPGNIEPGNRERQAALDAELRTLLAAYRQLPVRAEDRAAAARFERDWNTYLAVPTPAGDQQTWDTVQRDLTSWREQDVASTAHYRGEAHRWAVLSLISVAVLLAAAIAVVVRISRLLEQRLTEGLDRLGAATRRIASGDADAWVRVDTDDEIGSVARAFDGAASRPNGVVRKIEDQAQQLAAVANHDGLTGVPNRRSWDLELARGMAAARRGGEKLTVAVLDLDHFKAYNDTHGHQAGDALLRQAAAAWRAELRQADLLARYGGEKFTIMSVGLTQQQMAALVERLRPHTPFGQTFSAGVAEWDGSETSQHLVARADEALYQAKHAGQNRTVIAVAPA